MTTLSLSMIVKDEEATLGRVLAQASSFCDELVVADTGSSDATVQVAESSGARVVHVPWTDDFAAARNASLAACTGDWVLWLDADDVVPEQVQAALREAKATLLSDALDAVTTPYRYAFSAETGDCIYSLHRERLVRRVPGLRWEGRVHEVLVHGRGQVAHREDLYVEHRPDPSRRGDKSRRNLAILEAAVRDGDQSARTLYYYARELQDARRWTEAAATYRRYLQHDTVVWERYAALVARADCLGRVARQREAQDDLLAALALDPTRADAFLALGRRHFDAAEWAQALPFYAAASTLTPPPDGFVTPTDYTWRATDHLGVCLINTGRLQEGIDMTQRSLDAGNPDVERLQANIRWALEQL